MRIKDLLKRAEEIRSDDVSWCPECSSWIERHNDKHFDWGGFYEGPEHREAHQVCGGEACSSHAEALATQKQELLGLIKDLYGELQELRVMGIRHQAYIQILKHDLFISHRGIDRCWNWIYSENGSGYVLRDSACLVCREEFKRTKK